MPELPEVETVRCGLLALLLSSPTHPCVFRGITIRNPHLRTPIPDALAQIFTHSHLLTIERRAKYLIWHTSAGSMLNHLGMTGSWRILDAAGNNGNNDVTQDIAHHPQLRTHDHCIIHCADGRHLVYNDPRRFGIIDMLRHDTDSGTGSGDKRLTKLGPEPLDTHAFHADYLHHACTRRRGSIKHVIMDQKIVVGVGNIYAAESLFRAGIAPKRAANRISLTRLVRFVDDIREVLQAAISAGGSTISDFRQAGGGEGYFQHTFAVYGREGQPCITCQRPLRNDIIGGRASVWCTRCQR